MKQLQFSTSIHASADKVWNALWQDANYREWTSVFSPGSYAVSDWKEGSKVQFLAGDGGGMQSTITKMTPNKLMSFRHEAEIKDGKILPETEEAREWIGATETYTLVQDGEMTDLLVEVDTVEKDASHFEENFPKSLELIKRIAERQTSNA